MAERVGFEPTVRFKTDNALAGRPIRPLWHLSWEIGSVSVMRTTLLSGAFFVLFVKPSFPTGFGEFGQQNKG